MSNFDSIHSAVTALKNGEMIIVCDDENRENEGDFIMAADFITPEAINFMATHGRGLICTPINKDLAAKLNLPYMVQKENGIDQTPFTVSIDYGPGNTTGISAADRSNTVKAMLDDNVKPNDFIRPGHIFPLIANEFGTLKRPGHTEATTDLMKIANLSPAGVICEIMNEDGTMARVPQLIELAEKWNLKLITIKELIRYRLQTEFVLEPTKQVKLPTKYGDFKAMVFSPSFDSKLEIMAVFKGNLENKENVPVRIHSQCLTGDAFGSLKCDCGDQLENSLKYISKNEKGLVIYLPQEGRNIGLANKINAYSLQESGADTIEANLALGFSSDNREYSLAAQVLKFWNIKSIELISFNPDKKNQLEDFDVNIAKLISLTSNSNEYNENYLRTKVEKMGHYPDLYSSKDL